MTQANIGLSGGSYEIVNVAYAAQAHGEGSMHCYSYKEVGHIVHHCNKKLCTYCKQNGYIIKKCPTQPQNG